MSTLSHINWSDSTLFQSGDYTVALAQPGAQLSTVLAARSAFCDVTEDLRVAPEGDEYDRLPNCKVFAVLRDGKIIGTIRNMVYNQAYGWTDCLLTRNFPEALDQLHGPRTPLLSSSRFAISPTLDRRSAFQVQGILFRVQVIANQVEEIDFVTTTVRPNHKRFYEKYMSMVPIASGLSYKGLDELTVLAVPALEECTFSYSLPETLGIDIAECLARYRVLKEQFLANYPKAFNKPNE